MQTEKARLEGERADWLERRRQEAEHWQAAKAAEIEADKQRKVQALLNDEVAAIERVRTQRNVDIGRERANNRRRMRPRNDWSSIA